MKRKANVKFNTRIKKPRLRQQVVPPRNSGFTLPGHDFLGPRNVIDYAPPRNKEDAAAKDHDLDYAKHGNKAYFTFMQSDQVLLDRLQHSDTAAGKIARWYFKLKKRVAPQDNFVTPDQPATLKTTDISPAQKSTDQSFLEFATDLIENVQSFSNLPTRGKAPLQQQTLATMSDGDGSGNPAGLKETPVDDVTNIVQRGPSNYTFASLPFLRQSNVAAARYMDQMLYRMTSPYDCIVNTTVTDANAGAGTTNMEISNTDAADTTISKARWFDFYAGMYKYYHVVACRWHLTLENQGDAPIWVHHWYQNETDRPTGAGNLDMLAWQDTNSYYVDCQHVAIDSFGQQKNTQGVTGGNAPGSTAPANGNYDSGNHVSKQTKSSPILQLSGEYRPGDYEREIRLDVNVENWTAVSTNPLLAERLCFRVRPWSDALQKNSATSTQDALKYTYFIRLEYLVEFKELKQTLRYPVQHQPLSVTVQDNEETE